ncbi:MAG: Bax inhibitor-1/YccA family protein [Arsenophonus sp. ET-YP4-MAG3]
MDRFEHQNNSIVQRASADIQIYMAQVYGWMTVGLLLTAFVAWYAINNSNIITYLNTHNWMLIILIISEFALVIGLSFLLSKLSGVLATAMFMLYSLLTGLTISLLLVAYTGTSVASTFFITSAMFGALSFYGYTTKRSLSGMGSFLFMLLIGLIIASFVNIWLQNFGLTLVITYLGVLIFSGLTAYDTQKLKDMGSQIDSNDQEDMRKYAIFGALTLYLDFINLFLMMLRIVGDRR